MLAVALFSGYGGASRGMKQAGLKVVKAYDYSPQEIAAHRWLEPDIPCEQRDVRTVTAEELRGLFVWASPSCKPYSFANRTPKRGKAHPEYYSLAQLAEQCRYAAVTVIENVMGLLHSKEGKEEMEALEAACHRLGLTMQVLTPRSNEHGVGQFRQRCIIILGAGIVSLSRGTAIVGATYSVTATDSKGYYTRTGSNFRGPSRRGYAPDEAARLQCLPVPPGSSSVASRLLGNAVPPPLAEAVCRAVLESLAVSV